MKKIILILCAFTIWSIATIATAQMRAFDFLGQYGYVYKIVWDGWKGKLLLSPNTGKSYLEKDGKKHKVRYHILLDSQIPVDGMKGPGYKGKAANLKYRIVFWVDFSDTPDNLRDDQRFDGYLMTKTKDDIAGITWWNNIPFGFYAIWEYDIPG